MVDLRVNEGLRLTQSSQDSMSLVIDVLMLISYSIMFYACKKRGVTVGKNYLIVFPILGGVFDVLIHALFVPTICSLLAMVLGFIDSKSTSHSILPTQVANQTDPVTETVYEQALDLSSDAYKIYLVKKYQVEKNHALAKFICRDRLFESIDQALQHAHELERQQKDNLEADAKNKQKRLELAKSLGIEEQDFGQGSTRLAQGYKVLGQKFYVLEDAIAYVEQQSDDERKAQATLSILNKSASRSLDLPLAQDAHKRDETQQPTVLQENYSWRREEAAVDSQRKKSKNTLPIFLCITVIVAAVFWRLGSETGGTTEKKDTVKPSTSKPYSQFQEPRFQESLMRHPDTELTQRIGIFNGEQLDAFYNSDEALGWVMHGSKVVFITRADSDLRFSQVYSPKNREGDYSRRYFRFSASAGNSCEGPHFILEFQTDGVKVHKIDSCDFWGHVVNHLLFTQTEVLYKETPKGGL